MLNTLYKIILISLTILSISNCDRSNTQKEQKLVLTGSSTVAPLATELARRFELLNPDIEIDVQSGGSSRGINDVRRELANIGMASRALKETENDLFSYTIALDGITIITHRNNIIHELSRQQIIDIYTDKINNWSEIGGPDLPITVVNKAEGRSTLELFLKFFNLNSKNIKADVVIGDNQQGIKTVAGNPGAIGYVSIGSAEYEAAYNQTIRLLPLDGVAASTATVKEKQFPLARPLNFVTKSPAKGLALKFINFARSKAAYDIVESQFFIPNKQQNDQ